MSRGAKIAVAVIGVGIVALLLLVVVLVDHAGEGQSTASKRVTPDRVEGFDTIVVLPRASAFDVSEVEDHMNRLDAVDEYAEVPRDTLAFLLTSGENGTERDELVDRACAETTRGYVVTLTDATPGARREVASSLGDDVTVQESQSEPPQTEIFMRVKATREQTAAVAEKLDADSGVAKSRFISHADAFEEFRRLFDSQPVLVESEPDDGSGLPESFRVTLRDGDSPQALAARYEDLPGVDTVKVPASTGAVPPAALFDVCTRDFP